MKVRIGSTKYDLRQSKDKIKKEDVEYIGVIQTDEGFIQLQESMPVQCRKQTFWHEVVHGMMDELGQRDLFEDEGFTDGLSKLLYGFHEDNKLEKIYGFIGANDDGGN